MLWSIAQVLGKQVISLIIFTVLSLILKPEDFGLIALALVWITFLDSFSETGFSSALIQRQNVDTRHFSSIFALNIGVGLLLTALGVGLSYPAALIFQNPMVQPLMAVLSLGFVVNAFSLTQVALAQKQLRFRDLFIRDAIATLLGGIVGIGAALAGAGAWSLVFQTVVTYVIGTVTLWTIARWRPRFQDMHWSAIKELWSYSSQLFIFNFFKFFAQNTDKFFIGYLLGAVALGIYTFAFRWTSLPITMFVGAIGIFLFPHYAAIQQDRTTIKKSYLHVLRVTNAIVLPLLIGVALLAPIALPLFWQDKWLAAIPVIQLLCILAYAQAFISPVGQLQKALNKPTWLLWWSVGATAVITVCLPLVAHRWGILGAGWVLVAVYWLGLPVNYATVKHLIHLSFGDIARGLLPSGLAGLAMAIVMYGLTWLMLPPLLTLIGAGVLGTAIYTLILWRTDQPLIRWVWSESLSRLRPKKSSL